MTLAAECRRSARERTGTATRPTAAVLPRQPGHTEHASLIDADPEDRENDGTDGPQGQEHLGAEGNESRPAGGLEHRDRDETITPNRRSNGSANQEAKLHAQNLDRGYTSL